MNLLINQCLCRCSKWEVRKMDAFMQLRNQGIGSVVMLIGEDHFVFIGNNEFQSNLFFCNLICFTFSHRKYKLEEVNKHELVKGHRNCVKFVKAWEERLGIFLVSLYLLLTVWISYCNFISFNFLVLCKYVECFIVTAKGNEYYNYL